MTKTDSSKIALLAILLCAAMLVLPATGAVIGDATPVTANPTITATVSSVTSAVGAPIKISGVLSGSNLTHEVQIWIFAGNFLNITKVPVNAKGAFTRTYQTTGLPPVTYYCFIQNPGTDGTYDIVEKNADGFAGQVVNIKTGSTIFSFTGTGSVRDKEAVTALSGAFGQPDVDDIYTKLTFQLVAPDITLAAPPYAAAETTPGVPVQTTTKSPVAALTVLAGICVAGFAVALTKKR